MKASFFIAAALLLCSCSIHVPEVPQEKASGYVGTFHIVNSDGVPYQMEGRTGQLVREDGRMDIILREVSFSPRMPLTLDLLIPDIPFSEKDGTVSLEAESVVPVSGGREYPKYVITSLKGSVTETRMQLTMDIGGCPSSYLGIKE